MKAVIKFEWNVLFDDVQQEELNQAVLYPNKIEFDNPYGEKEKLSGKKTVREDLIVVDLTKMGVLRGFTIEKILDKTDQFSAQIEAVNKAVEQLNAATLKIGLNEKCGVGIGADMLKINKVCVSTDCCTDYLQKELLDKGWRIIAVCPQPQRRPDYILGKIE